MPPRLRLTYPLPGRPISRGSQEHLDAQQLPAVDIAASWGEIILSPIRGRVTISQFLLECGESVQIETGRKYRHMMRFCHLQQRVVTARQWVSRGQPIGSVGATGLAEGAHLHWLYEIDGERQWIDMLAIREA